MRTTQTLEDFKGSNIIDSRDVIARRDELQEEWEGLVADLQDLRDARDEAVATDGGEDTPDVDIENAEAALKDWDEENAEELRILNDFIDEGSDEWRHGETLVAESHFEEYARELAEDLNGEMLRKASWPFNCIDWKDAARELQHDYTGADLDGETYYYRA